MKSFIKENLFILIIISVLFLYLGMKATNENGWDGWGFGSAQTLMSSQYWAKDGFIKNYFLFIPSPYSKLTRYFDSKEFQNRKIEDKNGALIRNSVYYTHYPPLYLFPYALLTKIGLENRAVFRVFSLLISLLALFLFYSFIKSISSRAVATLASTYYGFSVIFLNYADAISIQPWTILFTFLILNLSIQSWRNFENREKYRRYNLWIWISYLALSLSSYDATFFVFTYLILFDILIQKKFIWRKWLFWASAPILGFALQIFQNIWYLGAAEIWRDIYRSYTGRAIGTLKGFVSGLVAPFVSMTGLKTFLFFKKSATALGSAGLILIVLWRLKEKFNYNAIFFRLIFVLAVSVVAQPFLINVTGHWPYQGVLAAPFWGLVIGSSSVFIFEIIKKKSLKELKNKLQLSVLALIITMIWFAQFYSTLNYVKDWPNNRVPKNIIEFSNALKNIHPNEERMVFRILPENPIWKSSFPVFNFEYYLDMPKIDFANTKDLLIDFWWFRNISEYPFYSLIIAESKSDLEKIRRELSDKNVRNISPVTEIQGQYLFTVAPK